jgi:hypothetical protein
MNPISFFVNFRTRLQSAKFVVVLVLVLEKILILEDEHEYEDEYEKYQLGSPESAHI